MTLLARRSPAVDGRARRQPRLRGLRPASPAPCPTRRDLRRPRARGLGLRERGGRDHAPARPVPGGRYTSRGGYRQYREETGNVLPRLVVTRRRGRRAVRSPRQAGPTDARAARTFRARRRRDGRARRPDDIGRRQQSSAPRRRGLMRRRSMYRRPSRTDLEARTSSHSGATSGSLESSTSPSTEHVARSADPRRRRARRTRAAGRRRTRRGSHRRRPARPAACS